MNSTISSSTHPDSLRGHLIDEGSIRLWKLFGNGTFGNVYFAIAPLEGDKLYAVKALVRETTESRRIAQDQEVSLHFAASGHPHIVTLHRVFEESGFLFLVLVSLPALILETSNY